ncbi:chromosome segregation protein SMC [Agromyces sp. SYSU T00194]|uniref:chromosome segregation protein SMC n=1 Tax=Agromyces chitinivorans TaxID=3158560 RepID=UPI003399DD23
MYLKSLTLKGFKSFAQPTVFAFEPGVTCVVGPNGSGKSNVVDALAWVMGEQGAKTLRGGKMEDVIFAGTSSRGPLGRAEVSLTIDNSDGALPIEYTEVQISRTLFRNGTSEYAINGEACRLLDVQELLSDSGLGREMHVIVGQGQLDNVLHASADDRRGFIEEAAGILKHRRRKEKTLRKLDAMQANLTRLSDLAGEIRRQLKPLGRQAEVARQAQSIAAIVRDARARLLADEVVGLRRTLDAHSRTEAERHSERLVLQDQLEQRQARVARLEQAQQSVAVDDARRVGFTLESAQERLRGLHTLANQRLALLGRDAEEPDAAPTVSQAAIDDARAELEQVRAAVQAAATGLEDAQRATVAARHALDATDEDVAAQSAAVSRYDLELAALSGRADTAASRLATVRGEVLRQENALAAASDRAAIATTALAELEQNAPLSQDGETDLDEAYELAQAAVFEAEGEIERIREALHVRERERDALTAKVGALSLALDQRDGSAALVAAGRPGVRGLLAEHVQVQPGFEAAIAAALGTLTDAVLVDDRDAALDALAHARGNDLGRVELALAEATTAPAVADVDGLTPAASVVTGPPGVAALLARTVIADDVDAVRAASAALDADDVTVVTRDGAVIGRYVIRGGSGEGRSRIELIAERDAADARLGEVRSELERRRFELGEQRSAHETAKQQSAQALTALREYDAQLAAQTEQLNKARVTADAATAETERLAESARTAAERVAEAEQASVAAKDALEAARATPRPVLDLSARDAGAAALEAAREQEVEARLALETARERVRSEEGRIAGLERRREAERRQAEEAARRAVIRRRQYEAARRVADALPAVLSSVDASVSEARIRLARAEEERAGQNEELNALRRDEASVRERLQSITEDVHGLELQIYEKKLHVSSLLERAQSELGLAEDVLADEYGPDQPVPSDEEDGEDAPFDRAVQQRRLKGAERMLAQLGRVNPLALEEFAALEQRHAFLTEQLADLTKTRADLVTIIEEIDRKMVSIFQAAFEDTRAAFGEVFPVLFPGGTGSIALTDPDDLLTSGIEVSVKPAGKKIERLSLLSGGERSLAAVALLIAIFKARPSPFYILDEVEAALDDANLGRLLTVIEELRDDSQLIVITHQKRTMEIADALYGVSMRQDGVSAVVGQRVREERASA